MTNLQNVLAKHSKGNFPTYSYDKKERSFIKLAELPLSQPIVIEALFINTSGKFGAQGVIVTSENQVNLPNHLTSLIEDLRSDEEATEAINHRELAFEVYQYETESGHKGYSINLVPAPTSRAFNS